MNEGVYTGTVRTTIGYPRAEDWYPGQIVYLEGLRVKVKSVTFRPITVEELADWPNSNPDDRIVTVEFIDTPL